MTTTRVRASEANDRLTVAFDHRRKPRVKTALLGRPAHGSGYPKTQPRAKAAEMCGGCPVITECDDAAEANGERFGTWAGKDCTRAPGRKASDAA